MSNTVARILLLLASSDIRESELKDFGRWVASSKGDDMLRSVLDLRRMARSKEYRADYSSPVESEFSVTQRSRAEVGRSSLAEKVERLLILEAGLPKKVAAHILREQIERQLGPENTLPSENKIAFSTWVERLVAVVPGSQLIHIATKIRNDYVHSNKTDWPLVR